VRQITVNAISPGWIKDSVLNIANFWRVDSSIKSWNRLEKELDGLKSAEPCGYAFTNV
jgi:NAD(P)-dependent dehydrogenase (short-subunit alcohol dehydrogenase family)